MQIGMFHLHVTVVTLFLVFLTFKCILLLLNKTTFLDKMRAKTKVVDMVLGTLIILTGGYLAYIQGSTPGYLWVKICLMLIAIPLGLIGIKRHNKVLSVVSVLLFIYIYGVAETKSYKFQQDEPTIHSPMADANVVENGRMLYATYCANCHGADGKKGLYKASDLSISTLSHAEVIQVIKKGRGSMMQGYENRFSSEQIEALSQYVESLKE